MKLFRQSSFVFVFALLLIGCQSDVYALPGSYPSDYRWEITDNAIDRGVLISASIGSWMLDVEGYTSPGARVSLESTQGNIHSDTLANLSGYFVFRHLRMPYYSGDICFYSSDQRGLPSNPLCLAPPPHIQTATVSGIILPPTLSMDKNLVPQGEDAAVEGLTVPNSQVQTYLFETDQPWLVEFINTVIPAQLSFFKPKPIFARTIPKLTVVADSSGYFSFNLPSHKSTLWRFFLGSDTRFGLSPRSSTYEFRALACWQWLLYRFVTIVTYLFVSIGKLVLHPLAVIILEIPLCVYLVCAVVLKKNQHPASCLRYCNLPKRYRHFLRKRHSVNVCRQNKLANSG